LGVGFVDVLCVYVFSTVQYTEYGYWVRRFEIGIYIRYSLLIDNYGQYDHE
jgi:hypothetical protein